MNLLYRVPRHPWHYIAVLGATAVGLLPMLGRKVGVLSHVA